MNKKMPIVFAGHGSPMNAIEDTPYRKEWERLGKELPRPKAILAISAHWYTQKTRVQADEEQRLIYDFYGFPKELYQVEYPAKGSPELASRVNELLEGKAKVDASWGLDHGTWSVLRNMYPDADLPIIQLSIDQNLSMREYAEIGKQLAPLRDEGILIFASGNIVHSFQYVNFKMENGYPWAVAFDDYIYEAIMNRQLEAVIHYERMGPEALKAFQTLEHYAPLLFAMGASSETDQIQVFNRSVALGSMSMTGYVWQPE